MATTKATLAARVLQLIGNRSGYDQLISDGLDAAVEEISSRHDFVDLITTPADVTITVVEDASYATIPTGYNKIKFLQHVRDTIESPIELRTKSWAWDRFPKESSETWVAFIEGTKLYILPDPSSGDKVRFTMVSSVAFTGGTTLNVTKIDRVVVAFAASYALDGMEIPVSAERWYKRFERAMATAITEDNRKPRLIMSADVGEPRTTMEQILDGVPETFEA